MELREEAAADVYTKPFLRGFSDGLKGLDPKSGESAYMDGYRSGKGYLGRDDADITCQDYPADT